MSSRAAARVRPLLLPVVVLLLFHALASVPMASAQAPRVLLAEIQGPIDRSTLDYVIEAIAYAESGGFAALVVRFDTPGGGLDETLEIANRMVRAANLPVLGFVGPVGASAVSAGTVLLVATDVAAMAPGTTIGSVQPVVLGPGGFEPVTDSKIINYVVEKLEEHLRLHGRNESLAQRFVVDNLNLNASEAQRLGATEVVASSVADFLRQADGRRVVVQAEGDVLKDLVLDVADAEVVTFAPSLRVGLLAVLSDPLVASLLMILGIYAIVFGLSAPGHGAEIAGTILLLLALIGLGFSVDPVALFLILLGVIFLVVELKTPGFGAFGVGGIVSMVLGAVFLAPLRPPDFVVSPEYQILFLVALLTPTAAFGGFLLFALYKVLEIRRRKPAIGAMVNDTATVQDALRAGEKGYVLYAGELWQAVPSEDVRPGESVHIHAVDGIVLRVAKSPAPAPAVPPWKRRLQRFLRIRPPGPGPGNP